MRPTSKVVALLAVVLSVSLWSGNPATGKPCPSPPCGDDVPAQSVELGVEASIAWAEEPSDTIVYTISVTNGTGADVVVSSDLIGELGTVAAGEPATFSSAYSVAPHYAPSDRGLEFGDDPVTLTHHVTATAGGEIVATASVDVELHHDIAPCDFTEVFTRTCIWRPEHHGDWKVTVDPSPVAKRGHNQIRITLRDHVPGNWCQGSVIETWSAKDPVPLETTFSIPDWTEVALGEPVCPGGGALGDLYNVGTLDSFYLAASGHVSVEHLPAAQD